MKIFSFITLVIPVYAIAMENQLQTINSHLDTLQRPHITIINRLPLNDPNFPTTRIDISNQTKITKYIHNPDSIKTIYANKGIRFSPQINKFNGAMIVAYIHGTTKPRKCFMFGKGSPMQFGDTITFTTKSNNAIVVLHNDKEIKDDYETLGIENTELYEIFNLIDLETFKSFTSHCK